jgi:ComF family protein
MRFQQFLARCVPAICAFCRLQPARIGICADCQADLPRLGPVCSACAEPLQSAPQAGLICARCQHRPPPWVTCRAALPYAWPVDVALRRLKYSRQLTFAAAFGELLALVPAGESDDIDALCPVPLHRWRHLQRGFNQAEELCLPLHRRLSLPIMKNVRRIRHTPPQSGLGRQARQRNLRDAFSVQGRCSYRHPLLIDDVMTTGETCRHLALALLAQGADKVSVLTVARAAVGDQAAGVVNV